MEDIFSYYEERENHTAVLAEELIELQQEIDEEETDFDPAKVTWSNLRVNEKRCKTICGFSPMEFLNLYDLVQEHINENVGRGLKSKISKQDKLVMVLCYLKHYETLDKMKDTFYISASYLYTVLTDTINAITPILYKYYVSNIKERIEESEEDLDLFPEAKFIMDVTFQTIWTPTGTYNEKKLYYSGKHKLYGLKSQCIHDRMGRVVSCIPGEKGALHDLTICRSNIKVLKDVLKVTTDSSNEEEEAYWAVIVDSGYQGLQNIVDVIIPHKKQANKSLTKQQKTV
jgi:hypothetical protein